MPPGSKFISIFKKVSDFNPKQFSGVHILFIFSVIVSHNIFFVKAMKPKTSLRGVSTVNS